MKKYKRIYIEITNVCNLACSFCPGTHRSSEMMSVSLFKHILKEIEGHTEYLYFHVMGEPLIHPEIGFFLDMCSDYKYKVQITTNGSLLAAASESLMHKPALRQVSVSLHSLESSVTRGVIDAYLKDVFNFIQQIAGTHVLVGLRLWNLSVSDSDRNNAYILECLEREFHFSGKLADRLAVSSGIKLAKNIYLNVAETFEWPSLKRDVILGKAFCYGLNNQLAILADGSVVPCCLDGEGVIRLGNIKEQALCEIIASPRAVALHQGFQKREAVEELCQKCSYRTKFLLC